MSMTIEEIKKRKSALEIKILEECKAYEKETDTRVTYIRVESDDGDFGDIISSGRVEKVKKRPSKGLLNVTIDTTMENDVRSVD